MTLSWMLIVGPGVGVGLTMSLAARAALGLTRHQAPNEVPPDPLERPLLDAWR